eukprot:106271-Chlamydomonas_euryale.AAC.2
MSETEERGTEIDSAGMQNVASVEDAGHFHTSHSGDALWVPLDTVTPPTVPFPIEQLPLTLLQKRVWVLCGKMREFRRNQHQSRFTLPRPLPSLGPPVADARVVASTQLHPHLSKLARLVAMSDEERAGAHGGGGGGGGDVADLDAEADEGSVDGGTGSRA